VFFNEQSFCHLLAQGRLSFAEMSQQLAMAELEHRGKTPSLIISANTQAVIYQHILDLLPGFAGYSTPMHWVTPATSLTLGYWLMGLSRFEPGTCREELLKDTALWLQHLPVTLDEIRISNAALALQHMAESEGVREILKVIRAQLVNNIIARRWVSPEALCNVLYSLKIRPDSAEVKAILHVLLSHLTANITVGVRFAPEQIEDMLYSLFIMPDSPEAMAIYLSLQPQIIAAGMMLDGKALGYAFYLLRNLPESVDMAELANAFLAGLQARIQDEQKLLDPPTLSHILNSLYRFPSSSKMDLLLSGIKKHLDKNAQLGKWLDGQTLLNALYGLQYLTFSIEVQEILIVLQMHILNVRENPLPAKAKGYWLTEVIYSLRRYFEHPQGERVAKAFLQTAAHVLDLAIDMSQLSQASTRMRQIVQIGGYLIKTAEGHAWLDVRCCSPHLAPALCQFVLDLRQQEEVTPPLTIVFPAESTDKMQSRQRKKISQFLKTRLANEICYWESAQVTLLTIKKTSINKRDASALLPANTLPPLPFAPLKWVRRELAAQVPTAAEKLYSKINK
jgi:hypothetical protein